MDSSAKAHSNEVGRGSLGRRGRMDLSFRMGRGTGSQSPCTGLERKRRTVPLLWLDLQTLQAGKGLRVHTHLCTIHTHHISACERQACAACWEPHVPSAVALRSGITHTHTHPFPRPGPGDTVAQHNHNRPSESLRRNASDSIH